MNTIKRVALFLFATAIFAGCGKINYRKTAGGMPYRVFPGSGKPVNAGNVVKVSLTQRIKDSVYFTTGDNLPVYIPVSPTPNPYDISEIWAKVNVGDSIITTQMMDTFIHRQPGNVPPQFKNGDRIVTTIKVLAAFTSDSAATADEAKAKNELKDREIAEMAKYLSDQKIATEKTPKGVFVQIITPGTGPNIDSGKYISLKYTGTSMSGKRFDSNTDTNFHHTDPLSFVVGTHAMIDGFDEATKFMKKGTVAKIYIPSMLGYGSSPGTPLIKPFEAIMFDIEVLDVQDKAPAPKQTAPKVDMTQPKK